MSTKIYDAYKWNGSLQELIIFLNGLKKKYIEDCTTRFKRMYAYDEDLTSVENVGKLYKKIQQDSSQLERCYPFDIEFDCVVYQHKNQIVVQFFGYNEYNYPSIKSDLDSLQFFSYWNNSDGPDDMPEAEFESIGEWFEDLFKAYNSYVPSECGLHYSFGNNNTYFTIADNVGDSWK